MTGDGASYVNEVMVGVFSISNQVSMAGKTPTTPTSVVVVHIRRSEPVTAGIHTTADSPAHWNTSTARTVRAAVEAARSASCQPALMSKTPHTPASAYSTDIGWPSMKPATSGSA